MWTSHIWTGHFTHMTHTQVWQDSFICVPQGVTWHIHVPKRCEHHTYVRVTSHIWLIHRCDKTHLYVCHKVWHDTFMCMQHSRKWCEWVIHMSFKGMCHVTHIIMNHVTFWNMIMNHVTIWMHHVAHMNESFHTCEQVILHVCKQTHLRHDIFTRAKWLVLMCVTSSYVCVT